MSLYRSLSAAGAAALLAVVMLLLLAPTPAASSPAVEWPDLSVGPQVIAITQPTYVGNAGDGGGRLFVSERAGRIHIAHLGRRLPTPFLDISDRVSTDWIERGLYAFVFPPDYAAKGYFYVSYSDLSGDTVISRFHLTADPNVADPASEEQILVVPHPNQDHHGGQMRFDDDGYMVLALGDGDEPGWAQDLTRLRGKLLRIDTESGVVPYAIPADNPYVGVAGARDEILASGFRNPWRFGLQPQNGDLLIGDVGEHDREEINLIPGDSGGGQNFGWDIMEGTICFDPPSGCDPTGLTPPLLEYTHADGCAVTGGEVYRGALFPRMQDIFFYADFCSGKIWGMREEGGEWISALLLETELGINSFGIDEAGTLYVTDYFGGQVLPLRDSVRAAGTVLLSGQSFGPSPVIVDVGETVGWRNLQGLHNVTADDGSFTSGIAASDKWLFRHTFDSAGAYPYYCDVHGGVGGSGMAGTIYVQDPAAAPMRVGGIGTFSQAVGNVRLVLAAVDVRDAAQAPVAGAVVVIQLRRPDGTIERLSATTGATGAALFVQVSQPGTHSIYIDSAYEAAHAFVPQDGVTGKQFNVP